MDLIKSETAAITTAKAKEISRSYLIKNRLEDVILMIQFLGLRKSYSLRDNNKEMSENGKGPRSAGTWADVCRDHPEFFEVTKDRSSSLSVRFHLGEESGQYDPVPLADVQQLIKNALEIHERQFKVFCDENERKFKTETDEKNRKFLLDKEEHDRRVQKWRNIREWLTMIGATIAGGAALINLIWSFK